MASVRGRNGRYMGIFKLDGKQESAGTFETPEEALEEATKAEARARADRAGIAQPTPRGKLTVEAYMPVFLSGHHIRETSRATYTS